MARRIKFGVRIHQGGYGYEALRDVWREADSLGFYSASLYDLLNAPTLECWTTISALARETRRIRLVPLALANLYRHPAVLAKMTATLDVISGGRLELGIGAGGDEGDHRAAGLDFPDTPTRVAMLEESIEIIRRMWAGPATFQGDHYRVDGAVCDPAPAQKPRPRILIGGHGERHLLRAVASQADICNMRFDMSVFEHGSKREVLQAHCDRVGRDISEIEISHNTNVLIAQDQRALDHLVAAQAAKRGTSVDDYRAGLGSAIVGTPDECVEKLSRYVDVGITYFFLLFPHPVELDQLRLFAERVMPRFLTSEG